MAHGFGVPTGIAKSEKLVFKPMEQSNTSKVNASKQEKL